MFFGGRYLVRCLWTPAPEASGFEVHFPKTELFRGVMLVWVFKFQIDGEEVAPPGEAGR